MKSLHNRDIKSIMDADPTKSSVLIPEKFIGHYKERTKDMGSQKKYLSYLIDHYLPMVEVHEARLRKIKYPKWKTCYQEVKLGLKKKSFTPNPDDWERLRNSAAAFGVSMCFLFVFLMTLEIYPPEFPTETYESLLKRNSAPNTYEHFEQAPKNWILTRRVDMRRRRLIREIRVI